MSRLLQVFESRLFRYSALILAATLATTLVFPGGIRRILSANEFLPHATCYLQNANLIRLHVITDMLIGLAYVSISLTLGYLVWKASKDIPFHWMFLSFGLFIVSCGFTHFMEVWTVWQSVYWLSGYVKAITATASVVTAIALFPLVPKVFAMINSVKLSEERRQRLEQATTELQTTNAHLAERKQELEAANRDLEMFNYSVAHDLRAPLRSMQGFAELLKEGYTEQLDETGKRYGSRIVAASQSMERLLNDLLTYSKTSRNAIELRSVNLQTIVSDVLANFQPQISEKNARVEVRLGAERVMADPTLLLQVLSNLLSNALNYVNPTVLPKVLISTEPHGDRIRIFVQDNGVGIPSQHHGRIFQVFERLNPDNSGSGLGLAIVHRAVERMNGRIAVESTPGEGSLFSVDLPRANVPKESAFSQ